MTEITIDKISSILEKNAIAHSIYEVKSRIYFNSAIYTEYLQFDDVGFSVKVFLKNKNFGDSYSKSDYAKCLTRIDELHAMLQGIGIDKNTTTTEGGNDE